MERFKSVLLVPLATRAGTFIAGGIGGVISVDPALAHRIEAWIVAGVFIAADIVISALGKREGR